MMLAKSTTNRLINTYILHLPLSLLERPKQKKTAKLRQTDRILTDKDLSRKALWGNQRPPRSRTPHPLSVSSQPLQINSSFKNKTCFNQHPVPAGCGAVEVARARVRCGSSAGPLPSDSGSLRILTHCLYFQSWRKKDSVFSLSLSPVPGKLHLNR